MDSWRGLRQGPANFLDFSPRTCPLLYTVCVLFLLFCLETLQSCHQRPFAEQTTSIFRWETKRSAIAEKASRIRATADYAIPNTLYKARRCFQYTSGKIADRRPNLFLWSPVPSTHPIFNASCLFSASFTGGSVAEWLACWTQAQYRAWVQIAAATLLGNSLRQTVHTHCASVHQASKLVAALLRVAGVTAGLAESNDSLPPGSWLTSPAGWLPRTGISSTLGNRVWATFYHKLWQKECAMLVCPRLRVHTVMTDTDRINSVDYTAISSSVLLHAYIWPRWHCPYSVVVQYGTTMFASLYYPRLCNKPIKTARFHRGPGPCLIQRFIND